MKIILNIISTNLVTNLPLLLFSLFVETKKTPNFQHVGGLVTKNIFVFYL